MREHHTSPAGPPGRTPAGAGLGVPGAPGPARPRQPLRRVRPPRPAAEGTRGACEVGRRGSALPGGVLLILFVKGQPLE